MDLGDEPLSWGGRGGGSSVHGDVLRGCDWEIGGWEGVYGVDGVGDWEMGEFGGSW